MKKIVILILISFIIFFVGGCIGPTPQKSKEKAEIFSGVYYAKKVYTNKGYIHLNDIFTVYIPVTIGSIYPYIGTRINITDVHVKIKDLPYGLTIDNSSSVFSLNKNQIDELVESRYNEFYITFRYTNPAERKTGMISFDLYTHYSQKDYDYVCFYFTSPISCPSSLKPSFPITVDIKLKKDDIISNTIRLSPYLDTVNAKLVVQIKNNFPSVGIPVSISSIKIYLPKNQNIKFIQVSQNICNNPSIGITCNDTENSVTLDASYVSKFPYQTSTNSFIPIYLDVILNVTALKNNPIQIIDCFVNYTYQIPSNYYKNQDISRVSFTLE